MKVFQEELVVLNYKIFHLLKKQNDMLLCGPQDRIVESLLAARLKTFFIGEHAKKVHFGGRQMHQAASGTPPNKNVRH